MAWGWVHFQQIIISEWTIPFSTFLFYKVLLQKNKYNEKLKTVEKYNEI